MHSTISAFGMNNILYKIDKDICLLLDNLPVGILRLDSNKQCTYANTFIMKVLKMSSLTEICKRLVEFVHKDDVDEYIQSCRDFFLKNRDNEINARIYDKVLNEYRWMTTKRKVINANGKISYMYTIQDIHENKMLELRFRDETTKAETAYNHKSIFLANMSHEIRTPLNGIIGMLTLLEDTPLTTDQQDYINMIKECSFNLMTIINDILDYSKLEVGKITLDIKPLNLQECIESTNDIIVSKVFEKNLEYTYNIHTDIPSCITGDANRLKQVLLNLLSNAIKFTDKGSILLTVEPISSTTFLQIKNTYGNYDLTPQFTDKDIFIKFNVTDTGCGIHASQKPKLFKSFSQVDNHVTSKIYQGTGLGLAISKELVELMEGCIWLDRSESGKGSTFSFVIKCNKSDTIEKEDSLNDSILQGINVLILDDNLYNRMSVSGMITKWGMKPHAYSNSEEALYFARLIKFDIGLIDICIPKIDGPSFAVKLREQKEYNNKTFPLIALSSFSDKMTVNSNLFQSHLLKPIKESKLKSVCIQSLQEYINTPDQTSDQKQQPSVNESLQSYMIQNDIITLKDNIRILLAEDVYINQRVIVSFLNKLGFNNITLADNGQQCYDYFVMNTYDVILLDIRMPIMDGEVVLKKIMEHCSEKQVHKNPYVIAVTAYCLKEDKDRYLAMGFNDYIPKPVALNDLRRCMDTFTHSLLRE